MEKEEHENFEASDLSAVKQLLKSLDLEVVDSDETDDVSHQAFYNTFNRPDKEGALNEFNRASSTKKALIELIKAEQDVMVYWDSGLGNTLLQILVDKQDWLHQHATIFEETLKHEIIEVLNLPHLSEENQSKGKGQFFLNKDNDIVLNTESEEQYHVTLKLEQEDLWVNPTALYEQHRFFNNTLSTATKFKGIRRGFHAEITTEKNEILEFFFLPELELSAEEIGYLSALLLEKVNALTFNQNNENPILGYQPSLQINGQITDEKIAILSLEANYEVFEERQRSVILFEKE